MVAEATTLPGDALDQLPAWDVAVRREGDRDVVLTAGGVERRARVLVQSRPGMPDPDRVEQARSHGLPVLVTALHVSNKLAAGLRKASLDFVDASGNASIRLPGLVIEVSGRPRGTLAQRPTRAPTGSRSGVRVLLTLLAHPDTAGERTVRDIADAAGVSVGSAHAVMRDLREQRFLYDGGLDRTGLLFEGWLSGYLSDRALQQPRARFTYSPGWSRAGDVRDALSDIGAVVGGEDAAHELGLPLRGTSGILYSPVPPTDVVRAARLRRDPEGALQWRDRWWRPDEGDRLAPTPLIYADLLASDDPRQAEIAAELRRTDALLRRLDEN